ncbi:MAG TPA: FG-GAP-like repeat-containing protein [Edaphocola sp.]|nr:FG-GAP-like repeat-containing protein [Edaphocola sp.]
MKTKISTLIIVSFILFGLFDISNYVQAQASIKWHFDMKDASYGQSAAADIDGDGKLEIVFGCYRNDSSIYALNAENGSLLWKFNAGTTFAEGCNDVAPIIYDVDGDGQLDVIVPGSCNPKTFCFNGADGTLKWVANTRGSDSPPTIADIDGDGKPEIIHGEFGGYVICLNGEDGSIAWEIAVDTDSWIQTAPTIADVNNDGNLDIIVGTWNAVDKTKNTLRAYTASTQQLLWSFPVNDVMYHGTAVGDLDKDGMLELVFGNYNDTLYCLNANNGTVKWKYTAGASFYVGSPVVLADVNNDGNCDVIFNAWYKMIALNGDGTLLWEYDIPNYGQSFRGAAISDINNDQYPDVIFGTDNGMVIGLNGNNGSLIFNTNLRTDYGDSLYSAQHAPLVADFDNDGILDVFIAGGHGVIPFENNFGRAYMLSIGQGNGPDWLMFQNDIRRQSNVCNNGNTSLPETGNRQLQYFIYPNPSKGDLRIYFEKGNSNDFFISLSDITGKRLELASYELVNTSEIAYKMSLVDGLYFMKITDKRTGQSTTEKLIIKR